jgi:hypothetical protein
LPTTKGAFTVFPYALLKTAGFAVHRSFAIEQMKQPRYSLTEYRGYLNARLLNWLWQNPACFMQRALWGGGATRGKLWG